MDITKKFYLISLVSLVFIGVVFLYKSQNNSISDGNGSLAIQQIVEKKQDPESKDEEQFIPETLKFDRESNGAGAFHGMLGGMAVLEAHENTVLSSQVRSPIEKIHKKMGEYFQKGDVLIELDNKEYSIQFMKALAVNKRNAALSENKKKLYSQNIVSQADMLEAEANAEVSKADLEQARFNLENTVIFAPYTGRVKKIYLKEGELAKYGSELIEIIGDYKLEANILLPASYKGRVSPGDLFIITLDEHPDPVEAKVERVSRVIDPASATIKVEASIENSDKKLQPGMTGWAMPEKKEE